MKQREVLVRNEHGLHLRVAGELVEMVRNRNCKVSLSCGDCKYADACSIMQVLLLAAPQGTALMVKVDGPGEEELLSEIETFFEQGAGI
ncbi:MAG: hypothetical protein A2X49_12460 [Lentisphaerae bacterium GWF2_52_8]|nr:MAG: hypothetical protein A2X49_12460 [Lentisphaerae bacterium GWF2_52_8]